MSSPASPRATTSRASGDSGNKGKKPASAELPARPILDYQGSEYRDEGQRSMFERFTDRARRAVVQAQAEAKALEHNYIGPEHLLLGLTHEIVGGVGAKTLEALGVDLGTVRQRVEAIIGRGGMESSGHIPFRPEAKKALEM